MFQETTPNHKCIHVFSYITTIIIADLLPFQSYPLKIATVDDKLSDLHVEKSDSGMDEDSANPLPG